jgi:hypothetical protein
MFRGRRDSSTRGRIPLFGRGKRGVRPPRRRFALSTGRLVLSSASRSRPDTRVWLLSDLDAADAERDPEELEDSRRALPLFPIHLLTWMQERIMQAGEPFADGWAAPAAARQAAAGASG